MRESLGGTTPVPRPIPIESAEQRTATCSEVQSSCSSLRRGRAATAAAAGRGDGGGRRARSLLVDHDRRRRRLVAGGVRGYDRDRVLTARQRAGEPQALAAAERGA